MAIGILKRVTDLQLVEEHVYARRGFVNKNPGGGHPYPATNDASADA